jgi:hypothetical protein
MRFMSFGLSLLNFSYYRLYREWKKLDNPELAKRKPNYVSWSVNGFQERVQDGIKRLCLARANR